VFTVSVSIVVLTLPATFNPFTFSCVLCFQPNNPLNDYKTMAPTTSPRNNLLKHARVIKGFEKVKKIKNLLRVGSILCDVENGK
jgi:hypothetical protein